MTKEEMLRLLTAAYTGPGSAAEGTFAGDVLRACADGMAQLWSMEIDGLERRAFVSSAVGEWLTAVCADRGCVRKEGETDEELRARTLAALAATPASGNADHYAAWCGQAADILRWAGRGKPPAGPPSGRPRPLWTGSGPWARTRGSLPPLRRR